MNLPRSQLSSRVQLLTKTQGKPRRTKADQGGPRLGCPELGWAGLGRHLVQWPVKWVICSVALSKTKLWLSPACCCCCCCCFSAGNAPPKRSKTRWQWQQLWAAADQTSIQQQTTQAAVWSPLLRLFPPLQLFPSSSPSCASLSSSIQPSISAQTKTAAQF